ncbi:MAG TPA: sigma-54 dependent transcriptional regulator [Terriglobales bacterium]|nr:sigma-54 dependent transcriptional regulator [Terriglobales bacterium]
MTQNRVLVVDDEPGMLAYLRTLLEVNSFAVETVTNGTDALDAVIRGPVPDVVLLDLVMPGLDGLETLDRLRHLRPGLKVVMLSCVSTTRKVVDAIHLGAQDYLTKPFQETELKSVLKRCLDRPAAMEASENGRDQEELASGMYFIAASPAMRKVRSQAAQVAKINVPVLMLGESGVGKEVVARLIHKLSPRAHRTFLKVNCAALPSELLESELFGYEPGAFTGANRPKPGKFEICNHGTILLDEIGEMPPPLQAKLLHVLQDQQFSRLGGRTTISVDVRILAATNVNIQQAIASKRLREDLYYRLNAFTMHLPPLRERREEIPLLLKHFMAHLSERYARAPLPVSEKLIDSCMKYHWPGNLRELENMVKRYLILGDESIITSELDPQNTTMLGVPQPVRRPAERSDLKSLVRNLKDEAEMQAISEALDQTRWNRKEAARILNISYKALLYKIRQYGIDPQTEQRNLRQIA